MLADIYVGRAVLQRDRVDLHSHATFSCMLGRLAARIRGMFGRAR